MRHLLVLQARNDGCIACVLLALAFLMTGNSVHGQSSIAKPEPAQQAIDIAIAELGASQFQRRRQAFLDLWRHGKVALASVEEACQSPNLQVARAARALRSLLQLEISPSEMRGDFFGLLEEPTHEQVVRLCQRGQWELAEQLILNNSDLAASFGEPLGRYYLNAIAESALQQGDSLLAWPIVRASTASSRPDEAPNMRWSSRFGATTYDGSDLSVWLAVKLGLELSPDRSPDSLALEKYYRGDLKAALDENLSRVVRRKVATRSGQWAELSKSAIADLILLPIPSESNQAARAVLHEFGNDVQASDDIWQKLLAKEVNGDSEPATTDDTSVDDGAAQPTAERPPIGQALLNRVRPHEAPQTMLALMMSGRVAAVENYIANKLPKQAFGFYISGNEYAKALESVGLETDLENFDAWLAERETRIKETLQRRLPDDALFAETAHVCNVLIGLGHREKGEQLLDALVDCSGLKVNLWVGSGSLTSWLGRAEQRVLCLKAFEQNINLMTLETQGAIYQALFPDISSIVHQLSATAPVAEDSDSIVQLLDRLHRCNVDYLDNQFGEGSCRRWIERARDVLGGDSSALQQPLSTSRFEQLAQLASDCGFPELALEIAETDLKALSGSTVGQTHWKLAAKLNLDMGNAEKAAELLANYRDIPLPPNDQPALVDEVKALLLSGEYDAAMELDLSRWLRPLFATQRARGPTYAQVASHFADESDFEAAQEYAEAAFQLADFSSLNLYWAANDLSACYEDAGDYQKSADVLRAPLAEAMQIGSDMTTILADRGYFSWFRYAIKTERLHRAVGCVQRGDLKEAERHIAICRDLQPQDIEVVVQCYPRLKEQGEDELANRLFDGYEATMLKQIELWPKDSTSLNNLAWMYSQCDRKLEEALELSEQAVSIAPSSPVFVDTLAEVHYRLGNTERAIELALECLELNPRDVHYQENVTRFHRGE